MRRLAETVDVIDEVDDILDLAEEIGVQRVVFFNFVPVGRGEDIAALDLSPKEREELLRKLYLENERRRIEVYSTAPQYARVSVQMSSGQKVAATRFFSGEDVVVSSLAEYIGGCGAGRIYAAVQPDGSMTPCFFMPQVVVGNLRVKSFREIWEESPVLATLRNRELLKGPCGYCAFRSICSGCRARALAYTGDIMAPDPSCILNSETWFSASFPRKRVREHALIT